MSFGISYPFVTGERRLLMTDERGANLKEIGELWFDALNNQNTKGLDELVEEDVIVHSDNLPETIYGREAYKQAVGAFWQAFPDLNFKIEDVIVDVGGEMLAVRTTNTGTFKGELMGIPPTGKSFQVLMLAAARVRNGRLAEVWFVSNDASTLTQLGVME
jgi:steroid delta-isomerase-like uncharacterized protein